jgi:hypothetical protein
MKGSSVGRRRCLMVHDRRGLAGSRLSEKVRRPCRGGLHGSRLGGGKSMPEGGEVKSRHRSRVQLRCPTRLCGEETGGVLLEAGRCCRLCSEGLVQRVSSIRKRESTWTHLPRRPRTPRDELVLHTTLSTALEGAETGGKPGRRRGRGRSVCRDSAVGSRARSLRR